MDWSLNKTSDIWRTLQWRHNDCYGISNHQPHGCLLNRLFRRRSKEKIKAPRHWPLCGEFTGPVNSPHKGPVTQKMFPFDDVIMRIFKYMFSLRKCVYIESVLTLIPRSSIGNNSPLVEVTTRRRKSNRRLTGPMLTKTHIRHMASLIFNESLYHAVGDFCWSQWNRLLK